MRRTIVLLGLSLALSATQAQAQGQGFQTQSPELGTRVTPGKRDTTPKAIPREDLDKAVAVQFAEADSNRDGIVTLDEFNASVETRKAEMIRQRFARIDTDRNQSLSMAEFAAWQRSMGAVVLSTRQDVAAETLVPDELPIDLGRSREDQILEHLIRPLSATVIVEANADYDTGASLAELTEYQHTAFDAGDLNQDQWLTWDEVDRLQEKWGADPAAGAQ